MNEGEEFLSFRHVGLFNLSTPRNKLFFYIYLGVQMFLRNKFLEEEEEEEEFLKTKRLH